MTDKKYTIGQAADLLGVSRDTLRRLEKKGRVKSFRLNKNGYRFYTLDALINCSQYFDVFAIAKKWAESQNGFEPLPSYYCSHSSFFLARLSKLEFELNQIAGSKGLSSLLVAMTGEIGNNSFDHNLGNWPDVPGIFFGFDVRKKIIVLADRGRGILATLRNVKPNLVNDEEALRVAFTEIISGRAPENRGNGLKFVRSVINNNKISLFFKSGSADLMINKSKKDLKIYESKSLIRGCLAVIKI